MQIEGNTAIAYFEFSRGMDNPSWQGYFRQMWRIAYRRARMNAIQF